MSPRSSPSRRVLIFALIAVASPTWAGCGDTPAASQSRPAWADALVATAAPPMGRRTAPRRLHARTARALAPGAWSYFGDPRAVYAAGRTFVGWTDPRGYTNLAALRRDRILEHVRIGPRLVVDDHNNPALYVRPDGRVMVFYSEHNGKHLYYRTSAQPYSIKRMSRARTIGTNRRGWWGYTYPNPVRVDGQLWLMFRGADWQPDFTVNVRGHWTPARTLVLGPVARKGLKAVGPGRRHRPYAKYATDGDRIHAAFSAGCFSDARSAIYYAQFDQGGLRTSTGRLIANLGDAPPIARLETVRPSAGARQWPMDIAVDGSGRPVIVYLRDLRRPEFWWSRFDGSGWRHRMITRYVRRPESPGAVGGASLDHENPSVVYLARVSSTSRRHEVERWETRDAGRSWQRMRITRSTTDDLRPVSPRGLTQSEQVIWFAGTRTEWTAFDTRILISTLHETQAARAK